MATKKSGTTAKKTGTTTRKSAATTKKSTPKKTTTTTTKVTAAAVKPTRSLRYNLADKPLAAGVLVEFIGMFMLAAAMSTGQNSPTVALFAVAAIILGAGWISGGFLNPALAIGGLVTKQLNWVRTVAYIIAQVLGAMLALVVVQAFANNAPEVTQQMQMMGQSGVEAFTVPAIESGHLVAFFAELTGAAILGFILAGAFRVKDRLTSALTYGTGYFVALVVATFAAGAVSAVPVLNPALAITYSALSWDVWALVTYILGPIVGAVIGYAVFSLVDTNEEATV